MAHFLVTVQTVYEIESDKSKEAKEKALSGDGNAIEKKVVAIGLESMAIEDGLESEVIGSVLAKGFR